jgi:hypothetical protein
MGPPRGKPPARCLSSPVKNPSDPESQSLFSLPGPGTRNYIHPNGFRYASRNILWQTANGKRKTTEKEARKKREINAKKYPFKKYYYKKSTSYNVRKKFAEKSPNSLPEIIPEVGNCREKPRLVIILYNNINNMTKYNDLSNFPFHPPSGLNGKWQTVN